MKICTYQKKTAYCFSSSRKLKNALGFSPRFSGDIESSYLTPMLQNKCIAYMAIVYIFMQATQITASGSQRISEIKPFGTAKLTVSDIKLIWQSDSLDRFFFTVKMRKMFRLKSRVCKNASN